MANALSIVQDACGIAGIPAPTSLLSTTDPQAVALKAIFKAALQDLYQKDWPVLEREATITVVASTQNYALESDFGRIITDSAYDSNDYARLRGNISAASFQQIEAQGLLSSLRKFRISYSGGLKFRLAPMPDVGSTLTYVYITNNLLIDSLGVAKADFTADTDVPLFDPYLVQLNIQWRYKKQRGFDYAEEFKEAGVKTDTRFAQAITPGEFTPHSYGGECGPITNGYVPESGYGA